jgi:inward rectifier potassium channel
MTMAIQSAARSRRKRKAMKVMLVQKNGQFHIQGADAWYSYWRDPYHLMLTIPWWGFAALVAVVYVLVNAFFACLYLLQPDCLTGARSGSFEDAFFFSVHTLASIGYGVIAPKTTYANTLVTIEAIISLLAIAVITGLAFARFAKPTSRIMFSRYAVIAPHNGVPTLIFRAANQRRNFILEAQVRVYLSRDEVSQEGVRMRRVHDLKLVRDVNPSFNLTWNIMHPIDEDSPLYSANGINWGEGAPMLIVSLMGLDATVSDTISTRHTYTTADVLLNHRLENIIHIVDDDNRYVDYTNFHAVVSVE